MMLTEPEIQSALATAQAAFPNFTDWQYIDDPENSDYWGDFTMWGVYVANPGEMMSRRFFITLTAGKEAWSGSLTIGKHSYYWSSADFGDAYLVGGDSADSLDGAIASLQQAIATLFQTIVPSF
ncbi:MAG: hypothetical protein F6J87_26425 [Spirulina sp. SIO3F2]|nr:hypothetical protein [Spirulina sp. SIO3F2]